MDCADTYIKNIEAIANYGYKVYAFDFYEHATSNQMLVSKDGVKPSLLLDQILSFISHQSLQEVHIIGQGLGAWLALKVSGLHENMVNKLVLSSTAGIKWNPLLASLDISWTNQTLRWMFSSRSQKHPSLKLLNSDGGMLFPDELMLSEEELGLIKAKVLVVGSNHNEITPVDLAEYLVTLIPSAQYYCFTDSGFRPYLDEHQEFNSIVGKFLSE